MQVEVVNTADNIILFVPSAPLCFIHLFLSLMWHGWLQAMSHLFCGQLILSKAGLYTISWYYTANIITPSISDSPVLSKVSTVKMVCNSDKGTNLCASRLSTRQHCTSLLCLRDRMLVNLLIPEVPLKGIDFGDTCWCERALRLNSVWKSSKEITLLFIFWPLIKVYRWSFILLISHFFILPLHLDILA